jgi:hypothetical protein
MICPNHDGNYDCTPFCSLCAGRQEYLEDPDLDDAIWKILDYLEENNSHTLGRLLHWEMFGSTSDREDELMFRTFLVARNFLESFEKLENNV